MTRSRIEGLLAAFPKLISGGKHSQHTFVETDSIRYVYQPMDKLYMVLMTTKASNILEDLETLRLFVKVVQDYCRTTEELDVQDHAFQLLFAFDEIVALGYKESVNLAQIRTFTEMDSHEEKVFLAVRQSQEREAKEAMKRRAKELERERREASRRGIPSRGMGSMGSGGSYGGFGNKSMGMDMPVTEPIAEISPMPRSHPQPTVKPAGGHALKLSSKSRDVDQFAKQLGLEGEMVAPTNAPVPAANKPVAVVRGVSADEPVHLKIEERILVTVGRDGGLRNMEVNGMMGLSITDEKFGRVVFTVFNNDEKNVQLQTHPNVDKKLFSQESKIGLKNPAKPFPAQQDVGVLKWRFQTTDDKNLPLSINCWPNDTPGGNCDVNIEFELERTDLELNNVVISIPVPSSPQGSVKVEQCDGDYKHDSRRNVIEWSNALIDADNRTGSMEFSMPGRSNDFFPVTVSFFVSNRSFCNIEVICYFFIF